MKAPKWFLDAIASPGTSTVVEVDGTAIHFRTWGDARIRDCCWCTAAPPIALVGLSSRRCSPSNYFVAALDLSGHGDSGWRDDYPREGWAERADRRQ